MEERLDAPYGFTKTESYEDIRALIQAHIHLQNLRLEGKLGGSKKNIWELMISPITVVWNYIGERNDE